MEIDRYLRPDESDYIPIVLILASSAVAIAVSLYSLNSGLYFIFQNLFYLPIIFACFFYARRGFVFAVALSCLYVILLLSFTRDPGQALGAVLRFILFVFVAAVVASLSAGQQRAKEALAASRRTLSDLISFLPDATFARDLEGRIIVWNQAMERLTGTRSEDIMGKGDYEHAYRLYGRRSPILIDLLLSGDMELLRERYPRVRNLDGVLSGNIEVDDLYGRRAVLWATATPLRNGRGEVVGAIESVRDVTQFHDTRAQLQQANESLTLVNAKLQLLGRITQHDLSNTIQGMLSRVEMIKRVAAANQPLTEYLDGMDALAQNLRKQVEFARDYQSVGIKEPVWQNLEDTVAGGVATARLAGVTITVTVDAVEVYADPLLERVIHNLAMNAIAHGERTTRIGFSTLKRGPDLVIVCEDDGLGVPAHLKEAIFRREHYNNNGYGLLLVREILAITGLSILEAGTPGEGARFEILVPESSYRSANGSAGDASSPA